MLTLPLSPHYVLFLYFHLLIMNMANSVLRKRQLLLLLIP